MWTVDRTEYEQTVSDLEATLTWRRKWWQDHRGDPVSVSVLVRTGVVTEPTFHRNKYSLINEGLVGKEGTGNATRYRLLSDPDLL